MILFFYSLAWWLALPLILARLWWRGRREPGYRAHLAERLGWYRPAPQVPRIWLHAVSVGETRAAEPLILALLEAYPRHQILLTHMTPTGRATGAALFGGQPRLLQSYLPYDTGWMVGRFLRHFAPALCILMETEVWPNVMAQCARRQVPVALVNARLSARSLNKARRLAALMAPAARHLRCVAAQTEDDAQRLRAFGAPFVAVTGSVKFDVAPPAEMLLRGQALRSQIGSRPIFLCASTREGEEAQILGGLARLDVPNVLLIIVPRHPQRFDDVARMIEATGLKLARRSALGAQPLAPEVQVLLGDSMGEMFAWYAACDIAFIGGSLLPLGGQNLIEACSVGRPVLIGPHTFNFGPVTEQAIAARAAGRVQDAFELLQQARSLLQNDAQRLAMGEAALAFAHRHRGATAHTLSLLASLLPVS